MQFEAGDSSQRGKEVAIKDGEKKENKEEGPKIKMFDNPEIVKALHLKLNEYKKRLAAGQDMDAYSAPEARNWDTIYKIAVLETLLENGEVDTYDLSRRLNDKYKHIDVKAFNNACGVIDDYVTTGGKNTSGGTGLRVGGEDAPVEAIPTAEQTGEGIAVSGEKIEDMIAGAVSFDELFSIIDQSNGLQGSQEFFSPQRLRQIIGRVRTGERNIYFVTRTAGLRDKVEELLKIDDYGRQDVIRLPQDGETVISLKNKLREYKMRIIDAAEDEDVVDAKCKLIVCEMLLENGEVDANSAIIVMNQSGITDERMMKNAFDVVKRYAHDGGLGVFGGTGFGKSAEARRLDGEMKKMPDDEKRIINLNLEKFDLLRMMTIRENEEIEGDHEELETQKKKLDTAIDELMTGVAKEKQEELVSFFKKLVDEKITGYVADTDSFAELKIFLRSLGNIKGSSQIFKSDELIELITGVVQAGRPLENITRSYGLRRKVRELLLIDSFDKKRNSLMHDSI